MLIKKIKLKNFKCFTQKEIKLGKIVFFKGKNGAGKSTLALQSILFVLYGYSTTNSLNSLPTRNKAKSCSVTIEFDHLKHTYKIVRLFPTKLSISQDGKELEFANNPEAQEYINNLIGNRVNFMKFRIIDAYTKEANFLEEGQTTLKRILFANSAIIFNNMRAKLTSIKHEREIYNKEGAVIYTHYPSEKRLQLISSKYKEFNEIETKFIKELGMFQTDQNRIERQVGKFENEKEILTSERDKILKNVKCYACKQIVSKGLQKLLLNEIGKKQTEINNSLQTLTSKLEDVKDLVGSYRDKREKVSSRIQDMIDLKRKLEARLKQKQYIYTKRDVEIVKRAIKEVDRLSTYYLTESIKVLEPIINSVLAKIGFIVNFTIDEQSRFTITLQKDGITYDYKDLSGGQKFLLQIAFKLAILLKRNETGIIICDEGASSLDSENLAYLFTIFEQYPFQLFIIIHRFDNVPDTMQVINLDKEE